MSISAYQNPADVQLTVVNAQKSVTENTNSKLASSKIFGISFTYQQKAYRTKVMKVLYAGKEAMYKVVMPGSLNEGTSNHWLQRHGNNWAIVLGQDMDAKLLKVVGTAIDCLE
ncbi:hypothetical protein [Mucilaginibacter psychrotolerans]|uniref:Uncharacterized protein n=1 Tax=Mucilaginibacter psychrotolerans TaxID=1524096 RepID=A0A4Y8SDG1_9SPHI|nr:hypothetical protein [Mucilaginibacter psychrotolerans]TFF36711.1 hypothetical protein E2R66_14775 [Mucilaginibacter psychrotolerans]